MGIPMSLSVADLVVDRGVVRALDGVSLTVEGGEIVALLGANGAGKSTLLGAIAGVLPARSGRVTVAGRPLDGVDAAVRARAGVALVPEGGGVFPRLSVDDTLRLAAGPGADGRRRRAEVLDRLPLLQALLGRSAGSLSGGERRQVAIGRALALRPSVLLTDELTLGLSPRAADEVAQVIAGVAQSGVGILVAEQRADRALAIAARAVVLHRGRIALRGSAAELRDRGSELQRLYLGGPVETLAPPDAPARPEAPVGLEVLGLPLTNRQRRLLQERADARGETVGTYVARLVAADTGEGL